MAIMIALNQVAKHYDRYIKPSDRLWELITGKPRHQRFTALHATTLIVETGEVVGIIGLNGAGKSTLLKLVAKTLASSEGELSINGRVASLLELGTGFHPELSGRENVIMGCAIAGLSQQQTTARFKEIVHFAELTAVIDQPVKTYSSGMLMRLGFAVATSVDPDILIIDEALSVGDARFAQKSFQRIMAFKDAGKTILFCSHSLYQIEAICNRALWLDQGHMRAIGDVSQVVTAYTAFIDSMNSTPTPTEVASAVSPTTLASDAPTLVNQAYRFTEITTLIDGKAVQKQATLQACHSLLQIQAHFISDPHDVLPTFAVCFTNEEGKIIASAGNWAYAVSKLATLCSYLCGSDIVFNASM